MTSPSTNPSSCDSSVIFPPISLCTSRPSSNQHYTIALNCSSPATGIPAPVNDPSLPESSVPKIWLTTEMANQAAEDLEKGRAGNIAEWYEQYKQKLRVQKVEIASDPEKYRNSEHGEQKNLKRKLEDDDGETCSKNTKKEESGNEAPVNESIGVPVNSFNPLRRMELMANSSEFQPSTKISEVVAENQNKRERSSKSTTDLCGIIPIQNATMPSNSGLPMSSPHPLAQTVISHFPYPGPSEMMPTHAGMPAFPHYPPGFRMQHNPHMPMHPQMRQFQMHAWQMHQHRMMAARAQAGQVAPFPFMPPPPHPFPTPGPFSGPNPELRNFQQSSGPMTAPTAMSHMAPPFPSPMFPSPYIQVPHPVHRSPRQPDFTSAQSHPTPLYSFAPNPSGQSSSQIQDSAVKPPS